MNRTYRLKNVIYFPSFNIIGGVETFCYEMAVKYGKEYDITVCYKNGDPQQMAKIAKKGNPVNRLSKKEMGRYKNQMVPQSNSVVITVLPPARRVT